MKYILLVLLVCNVSCSKFSPNHHTFFEPIPLIFPIDSALISVGPDKDSLVPFDVTQASGVVSVTYSRPGVTSFNMDTSTFMAGSYPQVSGSYLDMGSISISALDDNSLKVCTGVGAPGNKCNRLYIRVFTLGSNISGSITGVSGFINTDSVPAYGIDVLAGTVPTPVGYNANQDAASVVNAATVFTYTISGGLNRVRLTDTGAINFPVKADLSNSGSGNYEMRLVIQYALGYVP